MLSVSHSETRALDWAPLFLKSNTIILLELLECWKKHLNTHGHKHSSALWLIEPTLDSWYTGSWPLKLKHWTTQSTHWGHQSWRTAVIWLLLWPAFLYFAVFFNLILIFLMKAFESRISCIIVDGLLEFVVFSEKYWATGKSQWMCFIRHFYFSSVKYRVIKILF